MIEYHTTRRFKGLEIISHVKVNNEIYMYYNNDVQNNKTIKTNTDHLNIKIEMSLSV